MARCCEKCGAWKQEIKEADTKEQAEVRIPEQIAIPFRLKSPLCSDPNRHPNPEQIVTPAERA